MQSTESLANAHPDHSPLGDQKKTIFIFALSNIKDAWDPDSIKKGITGSFEAVIYLSEQLAKLGYQVTVFGNPPKLSPYTEITANPRYVATDYLPITKFDYAIAWRLFGAGKQLKNIANRVYFWPHDTAFMLYSQEEIDAYHEIFWLSKWQREQWLSFNPSLANFINIYGNGINPDDFEPIIERANPYSCIYASNYAKGLIPLLDCWPEIKRSFPRATLDIYYGFCSWSGFTTEQEEALKKQINDLSSLGVTEHGLIGHKELHQAFSRASFWIFPCIGKETFCITALKAQIAGAVPVVIKDSALQDTVRHGYACTDPKDYLSTLITAMENAEKITLEERKKMKNFILEDYTWAKIAEKWKTAFEQP